MEQNKYFKKRICDYEDLDDVRFEVIGDLTHHFKISKKKVYMIDLRDSHDFFYDGIWLYDYISDKLWLDPDHDFNETIEYFEKKYGFYDLIECNCGQVLVHRVKKTPEQVMEMVDIAWSAGSWSSDIKTLTLWRGLGDPPTNKCLHKSNPKNN